MSNNKALIIGADHHNTLGVVESFAMKGILSYVILLTPRTDGYVLHSKYVKRGWCCANEDELVQCILANFSDRESKAVTIATNDQCAMILDKYANLLSDFIFIPSTHPYGGLAQWMNKAKMATLAIEVGLNVPETWVINDSKVPNNIKFPIITKAISSVEGSKDNIHIIESNGKLKSFLESPDRCNQIIAQRYIDKDIEIQLLGCSINSGEDIIIPGRTNVDRPNGIDNTFFLQFHECEDKYNDVIEKTKKFIRKTRYSGLFSVEFIVSKTGEIFFTEMNFRNDGNAICVTASGTNLPYIYYLSCIGGDYQREIDNSFVHSVYLVPELSYLIRMFKGEFTFREWCKNMRKANCYTTFFMNDKRSFFWFIALAIWKRIYKRNNV